MAQASPSSSQTNPTVASPDEASLFTSDALMWLLLTAGVLMVCFAGPIGEGLVPKQQYAPNSYQWSTDGVRDIASVVRSLGFMAFAAGLVERLVIQIAKLKA